MGRGTAAPRAGARGVPGLKQTARGQKAAPAPLPALEVAADLATLALLVVYFATLVHRVAKARFQSDECFHATIAEHFAALGRLPHSIPQLYGGFPYFHPPLFQVLGGLWIKVLGTGALCSLNVFVTGLAVLWIAIDRRSAAERSARRWAILLLIGNGWFTLHATRLYVEQLTALLAIGITLLILEVRREPRRLTTLALGVTVGLAVLAKHSSLVLLPVLGALVAGYRLRGERPVARAFAIACGAALLVAVPYWVRNALEYGSPIYPAFAPDLHPLLAELNARAFTPAPLDFYTGTASRAGWAIGLAIVAAFALAAWRRRGSLELVLLGGCVVLYAAGPLQPILDPRHMLPVIAAAAVLSAILVARMLEPSAGWRTAIGIALLLAAGRSIVPMPDYRAELDAPPELLQGYEAARQRVPEGETILSLWTYDTWYYARRPATWPIGWGQPNPPLAMFMTSDCDSVMLAFREHRIRYTLVPRVTGEDAFDGVNYPASFVRCLESLLAARRMELLWASPTLALIHVPEADSFPPGR